MLLVTYRRNTALKERWYSRLPTSHRKCWTLALSGFTTNQTGAFAPREIRLVPGNRQSIPGQFLPINFSANAQQWAFQDQTIYQVVLNVKIKDPSEQVHTSLVCFIQETGVWKVKLLQQRLYAHDRH